LINRAIKFLRAISRVSPTFRRPSSSDDGDRDGLRNAGLLPRVIAADHQSCYHFQSP
jgi:hypothetical protein